MKTFRGSCHCGKVVFEVIGTINEVVICNCSVCTKKGIIHSRVDDDHFRVIAGEEHLSVYRFGSEEATHCFCKICGIHVFGRPRMDPKRNTVNIRCLDDFERILSESDHVHFDGKHHPRDG